MSRKRTPEQGLEPGQDNATATATQEPAADAPTANGNGRSFAEAVGKRSFKPQPDPFGIATDNLAGVRLFESRRDRQMAIKFGDGKLEDKPPQEVIDKLKENGYRWNAQEKIWAHPVRPDAAMTTRIEAERLFQEVSKMIRQERGIESSQGIPF